MRRSQPLKLSAILVIFLSVLTSAWPWPRWLPELDALVVRRQDSSNTDSTIQASATQTGSASPSPTDNSASGTITTAPSTNSGSSGASTVSQSTSDTPTTTDQTSYDNSFPAGGVSMLTPAPLSGAEYYKIGDYVTFAWNYTSLLATPSAVNIVATCTGNHRLYTLAVNQTISNATQAVTWDTNGYQTANPTAPLLTETYTLIIYDAASSMSAVPQPGYLAPFNQFSFGMYSPLPYSGIGQGFQCVTCSGALSDTDRKALGFMFGMCAVTILSFSWFVGGINIIW